MDLEPYPGPYEQMTLPEAFAQVVEQYQAVGRNMSEQLNQYFVSIEQAFKFTRTTGTTAYRTSIPLPESKPNLNRNGPRRGPAYDHRGRRRW